MKTIDKDSASSALSALLTGMSLDSFRVYSTILLLGFYRAAAHAALPGEVWISCSGNALVHKTAPDQQEIIEAGADFFVRRASALGQLYHLIGASVTSVDIGPSGALTVILAEEKSDSKVMRIVSKRSGR